MERRTLPVARAADLEKPFGVPFLIRTRRDVVESALDVTPLVALIVADSEHDLFWAIDELGNPYEFEFSRADVGKIVWTIVDVARKGEIDEDSEEGARLTFTEISNPEENGSDQSGIADGMYAIYRSSARKWKKVTRRMSMGSGRTLVEREQPLTLAILATTFTAMNDRERADLAAWEDEYVNGDGMYATTDWPRWHEMMARYQSGEG